MRSSYGDEGFALEVGVKYPQLHAIDHSVDDAEAILTELSHAYENLSAFYRLGEHLLKIDELASFIEACVEDLKVNDTDIDYHLIPCPDIPADVRKELETLNFVPTLESNHQNCSNHYSLKLTSFGIEVQNVPNTYLHMKYLSLCRRLHYSHPKQQ